MASSAGRRNILNEICGFDQERSNIQNPFIRSPTSPEETLIQERGVRRKPATYKYDAPDPIFFKSPTNSPKKPQNALKFPSFPKTPPLRSSPRKRLMLSSERVLESEKGIASLSLSNKKVKLGPLEKVKPGSSLESSLKALSHSQLVQLINSVIVNSTEMHQVFEEAYPVPDLSLVEERLNTFQHNVFRSIPRNIWGSQDSAFCYLRVRTHLEVYKKECMDKLYELMDSQHWPTVFEYIFLAWKCTIGLPDWENVCHNRIKLHCLKHLKSQCLVAMKKAKLNQDALSELIDRMEEFSHSGDEFRACIDCAKQLMEKANITE